MVAYLDSSVLLRHILLGDESIRHALEFPRLMSSELLEIECRRVLHRYRLAGDLDDEGFVAARDRLDAVIAGVDLIELSRHIKQRAMEPFPVKIRTLDALHLATAQVVADLPETVTVFSHDHEMNVCTRSLGMVAALS